MDCNPYTNHDSRMISLTGCVRSAQPLVSYRLTNLLTSRILDVYTMSTYYDTELLDYISFRQSTHLNYHRAGIDIQDYKTLLPQTMKFVQQDLPTSILSASDDPKSLLELGIRYLFFVTAEVNRSENLNWRLARQWTGYGAPRDKPAAAARWTVLANYQEDVPLSLRARAHSSLARGWLDLAVEGGPGTLNIRYLSDAGHSANEAVALGLISPAVLAVASRIESAGFRRPEDNKFPEHSTEQFERLTDLWEALDTRTAEMAEEDLKREVKVSKNPLSYFCAAEDCGIVATKKSTLRRCGGGCPPAFKPSYCSKYCQKAVRFLSRTRMMSFIFLAGLEKSQTVLQTKRYGIECSFG